MAYIFLGDYLSFETLRENREALVEWRDRNIVTASLAYAAVYVISVA
ncbi:MAG: TVP38/TMEM64 family protein, partial [Xanthomonadales bacterium]|nr:TVP38/TMEM64 family protein [Xanthomonadales bacterium]